MIQLTQLTIYITEGDRWHHQQLYQALLEAARKQKMAGITVTWVVAGIGTSGKIRTTNILAVSVDLPSVVTLIDHPSKNWGLSASSPSNSSFWINYWINYFADDLSIRTWSQHLIREGLVLSLSSHIYGWLWKYTSTVHLPLIGFWPWIFYVSSNSF